MSDTPRRKATQVGHLGRAPRKFLGAVNTPVFRATTMLFRRSRTSKPRCAANTTASATACTACPRSPTCRPRSPRSRAAMPRSPCRRDLTATTLPLLALAKPGDHVLVTDSVYGPTRRFCELHLKRLGVEVELLRSAARRRHRARVPAEHADRLRRVAGVADVRRAGRSGHREGRACAQRAGHHGQLVGDAAELPRVRPRRRRVGARGDQIHRRAIPTCCSASSSAARRRFRRCTGCGPTWASRRRATTASWACAACARWPCAWRGSRPAASRSREWLRARPEVNEVIHPALPGSRGHELWKRDFRGATSLFGIVLNRLPRRASTRCSTACASSAWAGAGAASRA